MSVYRFEDRVINSTKFPWGHSSKYFVGDAFYTYRKKITIDSSKIDEDLIHFPLPIDLGPYVGINGADVTDIFDEVGSNYFKIAITKPDGTTQLYIEVEQWDVIGQKALLWVSKSDFTISSTSDTDLYLYYDSTATDNSGYVGLPGSRTEVWNSDFAAVYTMAQDPSAGAGSILDSTYNGNDGTPAGSMTSSDLVAGRLGHAIDFDGVDDRILFSDLTMMNFSISDFAVSVAFKADVSQPNAYPILLTSDIGATYGTGSVFLSDGAYGGVFDFSVGSTRIVNSGISVKDGVWHHGVLKRTAGVFAIILDNGTPVEAAAVYAVDFSTLTFGFALYSPTNTAGKVIISSVRFFSGAHSPAWIAADYHAQTDNLLTFG